MEYVKVIRIRESMRNCSRLKDTKETWQLNKQLDSELDPFAIKDIGTNVKIELMFKDYTIAMLPMLISYFWWLIAVT